MGWVANIFFILATWLSGNKNRSAFIAGFLGSCLYLFRGYDQRMYDLIFISFVMAILNVINWFKWDDTNLYWDRMVQDGRKKSGKWFWES